MICLKCRYRRVRRGKTYCLIQPSKDVSNLKECPDFKPNVSPEVAEELRRKALAEGNLKCPVCGEPISSKWLYCPFCRTTLTSMEGWIGTPLKDKRF